MRIILLSLLFVSTVACGQATDGPSHPEAPVSQKESDKFARARASFAQRYPAAESVSWNEDDNGNHEAEFRLDGEKYRADFSPEGNWIETENSIKFDNLPKLVQKLVEQEYDKDDITEIEYVDSAQRGKFFDIEFKQKGKNLDVMVRADGTLLGTSEGRD